jgi:pyruvate/2-oxoglutarate dehydrogenase complex dihydrolipoamide dehydrogenase (E3) component
MTDPPTYQLIVIGGGPAGSTAALRARELGASVALVERGAMGGTCTNDGCVPTRVLARAARLMANASQYADYGMAAPLPELDFQRLLARTQAIVYEIHEKKQLIGHLEAAGVAVYAGVGEARFVDPHTVALPDGRYLRGERFILAAGGRARRLDFPGEELALTHSDIWRLQTLPRSVAIVGGAATGCQLAAIFNAFGSQVTILDVAPRILAAEDGHVAQAMTEAFERRSIAGQAPRPMKTHLTRSAHSGVLRKDRPERLFSGQDGSVSSPCSLCLLRVLCDLQEMQAKTRMGRMI